IENPREVGADRIADAVAGFDRAKGGVVVVDFGTSTNFDVVTPKGEYLGGVLAPGLQISADALFSRASRSRSRPRWSGATPCTRCSPASSTGTWGWSTAWSTASSPSSGTPARS